MNCLVLVFSRDRALQLDATLRSFLLSCQDYQTAEIKVLYTTSNRLHEGQYAELMNDYEQYPSIRFIREKDFYSDVLAILAPFEAVLFLVDDNIFVKKFSIKRCVDGLAQHSDVLACSLRLGRNTRYCYSLNLPQDLPSFSFADTWLHRYAWTEAQHDFAYPLEVSSSLYRVNDIYELIATLSFSNPNTLEGVLADQKHLFASQQPYLLCFDQSITFCNPLNMVQTAWENRAGQEPQYSSRKLAEKFHDGFRIDVMSYTNFIPSGAHQEVPLRFVPFLPISSVMIPASEHPRVSVIIPCYNQAEFLADCVQSVHAQSFSDWEIIIVNDGSTDSTSRVAQELCMALSEQRVRLIEQENQGLAASRNIGIRAAKGRFILPLDADDCLHPDMLTQTVSVLEKHPDLSIVYTDTVTFGLREEHWKTGEVELEVLAQHNLICYCSLFRKDMWEAVGGYNPNMIWGYEDWDFWLSCWEQEYIGKRVPEELFRYRIREGSMYSRARAHDVELKAQIVVNHPQLYDVPTMNWAQSKLEQAHSLPYLSNRTSLPSVNNVSDIPNYEMPTHNFGVQSPPTKKSMLPLVSVILPTFNRVKSLQVALKSILQQTYENFEVIVVNDGGIDVAEIVSSVNGQNNVHYVRHGSNQGLAAARNSGIGVARGKYIAYLDDDDWYYPDHLKTLVTFLEESSARVAYTDAYRVQQRKQDDEYVTINKDLPYSIEFNANALLVTNYFPVLCVLHEKTCLDECGNFDESLTSHEDWDLWIRMSRIVEFIHIKKVTAEYSWRVDGTSMTSRLSQVYLENTKKIHKRYREYVKNNSELIRAQEENIQNLQDRVVNVAPVECSIIIPVFNRVELTQQCLTQLAAVTNGVSYEVIIVDNNSTDGTHEFLETLGGDVRIIRNAENLGFAKACNQGAHAARGEYLIFLNNDTIPQDEWLNALVEEAESDKNIAIVGSKLLFADGTLQHAGVVISRNRLTPYHIYRGLQGDIACANRRREFQAVTAACMLVKRTWFTEVQGFDEAYRNGFEDTDLCLRIGERGGKIVYQPKSWLYHLESQSPGRKQHEKYNASRFQEKWNDKYVVDEDCIALEDRMALLVKEQGEWETITYTVLKDEHEHASWSRVAQLQRLLQALGGEQKSETLREPLINEIRLLVGGPVEWPKDMAVMEWIGLECYALGFHEISERFFRQALQAGASPKARAKLTILALNRENIEEAGIHLSHLLNVSPNEGAVLHLQGVYFMQCKKFGEAVESFDKAIKNGGDRTKAQLGMGMAYVGMGQTKKAWDMFTTTTNESPDNVEGMNWLIRTGTELSNWDGLSQKLSMFVERNPANADMRFALAGVLYRQGAVSEAQTHLHSLQLLHPDYKGLEDLQNALLRVEPRLNTLDSRVRVGDGSEY